MTTTSTDKNI